MYNFKKNVAFKFDDSKASPKSGTGQTKGCVTAVMV